MERLKIEIHENDTNVTGTYKIWFNYLGQKHCILLDEGETNSLLEMRQKEDFFLGKYKFVLKSSYDIKKLIAKIY